MGHENRNKTSLFINEFQQLKKRRERKKKKKTLLLHDATVEHKNTIIIMEWGVRERERGGGAIKIFQTKTLIKFNSSDSQ